MKLNCWKLLYQEIYTYYFYIIILRCIVYFTHDVITTLWNSTINALSIIMKYNQNELQNCYKQSDPESDSFIWLHNVINNTKKSLYSVKNISHLIVPEK